MKTKPLGECPFCSSNNTYVQDDIIRDDMVYFVRGCWHCRERFIEFNRVVDMQWMDMGEFNLTDDDFWDQQTKRRNQDGQESD